MKKCSNCGALMSDGFSNCPKCGAKVNVNNNTNTNSNTNSNTNANTNINDNLNNAYQKISGSDHTNEFSLNDISENKLVCALSYLGILFFLPLVVSPGSQYGRFHANQSLLILILGVIFSTITGIFSALSGIPFIGFIFSIISGIISAVAALIELVLMIIGIVNTLNGKAVELPIIGKIRLIK